MICEYLTHTWDVCIMLSTCLVGGFRSVAEANAASAAAATSLEIIVISIFPPSIFCIISSMLLDISRNVFDASS